jgi:hypothetical protein
MISLINVFTVDPASQHRLVDWLARATDEFVSWARGSLEGSACWVGRRAAAENYLSFRYSWPKKQRRKL